MTRTDDLKQALDELDYKTNVEWELSTDRNMARISFDGAPEKALRKILEAGWIVTNPNTTNDARYSTQAYVEPVEVKQEEITKECPKCGGTGEITEEKVSIEVEGI